MTKRDTNSHTTRWNVLNGPRSYMLGKHMGRKRKEGRVLTEKERRGSQGLSETRC